MIDKPSVLIVDNASRLSDSDLFDTDCQVFRTADHRSTMTFLDSHPQIDIALVNLEDSIEDSLAIVAALRQNTQLAYPSSIGLCVDASDTRQLEKATQAQVEELIVRPVHPVLLRHHIHKLLKIQACRTSLVCQQEHTGLDGLVDSLSTAVGIFEHANGKPHALYLNKAFRTGAGMLFDVKTLYGDNALSVLNDSEAQQLTAALQQHLLDGSLVDLPLHVLGHNNEDRSMRLQALSIRYGNHTEPVFLVSINDISIQSRTEKALLESNRKLASLINSVPGGIAVYDISDKPKILYANDMLHLMCGYTHEEYHQIMEEDYHRLIDNRDHTQIDRLIADFRQNPHPIEDFFRIRNREGQVRWMRMTISPYGTESLCNAVFIDVTHDKDVEVKNERMRNELFYRAEYDVLTGINNREAFYRLTAELLHANRDTPYVILVIDIDRFKVINELFGKDIGDRILISIADGLKQLLGGVGTFARMESDHFAACFPQRLLDMERIIHLFEIGLKRQNLDYHIQLSFGIYHIRNISVPINHMCDRAAMALKTIKGNAVQRFAYYDDKLRQELLDENAILDEMNEALAKGQFVPYLQPIFTVDTRQPVSVEVLVRWLHPKKGLIYPNRFIPLFESNGFISKLDFFIWEQACALLSQWQREGYPLPVSVNISRIDLYSPRICEQLLLLTTKYGISPSMLRLEITESAYSKDPDELVQIINQLRENGFIILMDDFGSGYSSLNVLMDMPVDILKLDMRFMPKLATNPRAASILTSVVRMAKWLHMPIIAEGVSTWEQLAFLRSVGCDHAQGYLFAKPMKLEEYAERFIRTSISAVAAPETPERESIDLSCLLNVSQQTDAMFNGMVGGIGIYELCDDTLEVRRVNDGYYELFNCTPKQVFDRDHQATFTVHPDDQAGLLQMCRKAAQTGRVERYVCRHVRGDGSQQMWLETRLRYLGRAGVNDVFCFTFSDVTEQKEFEQSRTLSNYASLLRAVYSIVYELNLSRQCYRAIYTQDAENIGPPQDLPWSALRAILSDLLFSPDDELQSRIFTSGYLHGKLGDGNATHYQIERRIKRADGLLSWASFTFIRIPSDASDEVYLLCIADVDSRKQADELLIENQMLQLKHQEQLRYQALMEHLGTSILEWDIHLGRVISSPGYQQYAVSNFDLPSLKSHKDLECFIQYQDLNIYRRFVNDLLAHNSGAVTLRILQIDGQYVWCRLLCSLIHDGKGNITRLIAAINQIDEQIKIRESYLDEQARFQTFADNFLVGLGIFEVQDGKQRILYLSGGYRQMLGYAEGEPYYDTEYAYTGIYPEDVPRFEEATRELIRTGKPYTIEYRVYHKNGGIRWMRSLNSVYPGPSQEINRIFAVIQDITELHALHSQMDTFTNTLPIGLGVYSITDKPIVRFENRRMKELLTRLIEGESKTENICHLTDTQIVPVIMQAAKQGKVEMDAVYPIHTKSGASAQVRVLSATSMFEGEPTCYCALMEADLRDI